MLLAAKNLREIHFRQLMTVYTEGNRENALELYPQLSMEQGIMEVEQDFYVYLKESFFQTPGAVYYILMVSGDYVSALRVEPYRDGVLLEAVETSPLHRRKGYAKQLIEQVMNDLGKIRIYSHIGKNNIPSIRLHESCGFYKISDCAVYIDGSVNDRCGTYCFDSSQFGNS